MHIVLFLQNLLRLEISIIFTIKNCIYHFFFLGISQKELCYIEKEI